MLFLDFPVSIVQISPSGLVREEGVNGGVGPFVVKGVVAVFELVAVRGLKMAAPVRAGAIFISEKIFVGEAPGAEDAAGLFK